MTGLALTGTKAGLSSDQALGSCVPLGTPDHRPAAPGPSPASQLTTQRSRRLVSLAVRTATLAGAVSGGACSVWMTREDWLKGLAPATFTCLIRNLGAQPARALLCSRARGGQTKGDHPHGCVSWGLGARACVHRVLEAMLKGALFLPGSAKNANHVHGPSSETPQRTSACQSTIPNPERGVTGRVPRPEVCAAGCTGRLQVSPQGSEFE